MTEISIVIEIRIVIAWSWGEMLGRKGHMGTLWSDGNSLCLDLVGG